MDADAKEVLLELLSHAFESSDDVDGLVYLDIQKIFYHLHHELDEDNAVFELLPYYWYIDGPVSDTVQQAVNLGLENRTLDAGPTAATGTGQWHTLATEFRATSNTIESQDMDAANQDLERVLDEYNVYGGHEEKIEGIYDDAPYAFQRYFKLHVLFTIEDFASGRPLHLGTDNLASDISTAEAYLPLDPVFEEFNELFSRFVNTAQRYFEHVDDESRELGDRFKQLSEGVWRLFCQQLRLVEHDPYYDDQADDWRDEYARTRQLVAADLVEFRRLLDEQFESEGEADRVPEHSSWGQIAAEYLDGT